MKHVSRKYIALAVAVGLAVVLIGCGEGGDGKAVGRARTAARSHSAILEGVLATEGAAASEDGWESILTSPGSHLWSYRVIPVRGRRIAVVTATGGVEFRGASATSADETLAVGPARVIGRTANDNQSLVVDRIELLDKVPTSLPGVGPAPAIPNKAATATWRITGLALRPPADASLQPVSWLVIRTFGGGDQGWNPPEIQYVLVDASTRVVGVRSLTELYKLAGEKVATEHGPPMVSVTLQQRGDIVYASAISVEPGQ